MRKSMKKECVCVYTTYYVCIAELLHCIAEINIVNKFKIYVLFGVKYNKNKKKCIGLLNAKFKVGWVWRDVFKEVYRGSMGARCAIHICVCPNYLIT